MRFIGKGGVVVRRHPQSTVAHARYIAPLLQDETAAIGKVGPMSKSTSERSSQRTTCIPAFLIERAARAERLDA
jgi:hypothetical protein